MLVHCFYWNLVLRCVPGIHSKLITPVELEIFEQIPVLDAQRFNEYRYITGLANGVAVFLASELLFTGIFPGLDFCT